MSAQGPRKVNRRSKTAWWESVWLSGLLQIVLAVYLALALTGPVGAWWEVLFGTSRGDLLSGSNPGGPVGELLNMGLRIIFGAAWCWLVPLLLLIEGIGRLGQRTGAAVRASRFVGPLWLTSTVWIAQPNGLLPAGAAAEWGGVCGVWLGRGFHTLFGMWGGRIFLTFLLLTSLFLVFRPWLMPLIRRLTPIVRVSTEAGRILLRAMNSLLAWLAGSWLNWQKRWAHPRQDRRQQDNTRAQGTPAAVSSENPQPRQRRLHGLSDEVFLGDLETEIDSAALVADPRDTLPRPQRNQSGTSVASAPGRDRSPGSPPTKSLTQAHTQVPVKLPGLELLRDPGPEMQSILPAELDAAADLLETTLSSFGVQGEVKDVRPGPVVTTFEYQPAAGIKVSQIVQRADDLALAMKARTIRMEAPIPGKAAVGIEIPNPVQQVVRLKEVLQEARSLPLTPLSFVLGKDVIGQPVVIDIAKLPHLLVAGSTGSGKSVCLNSLISNLLLQNEPNHMRLVLIDPKMLEMSVYNGIPHLLLPVVTDPKEALRALKWMVAQMELRYRQLARAGVRDIAAYNAKVARGEVVDANQAVVTEPMPFYLTIVDELADLMIQLGQEIELPITRLAQKARAVGIHLILATQRPSVDVLTGVIKANIPCRIAFRVIQKNDSRTILDMNGAEQLLGSGDMLYLQPGRALPVRVHGSLVEVDECEAIVRHWAAYSHLTEDISLDEGPGGEGIYTGDDDLFEEAKKIVILHQSGSTSLLQRRLRIGYTRAGRLIDMLEEAGVVGPFTGSKAREVLLKPEDLPEWDGPEAGGAEA